MLARQAPHAEVITQSGARFRAQVSNLASTGLFLSSTEPLAFGQRLTLKLLGVSVRGEVLFVSGQPSGAVVGVRASPTALATLEAYRDQFDVLSSTPEEDPWSENTTLGEPHTQEMLVHEVLALVEQENVTPFDLAPETAAISVPTGNESNEKELSRPATVGPAEIRTVGPRRSRAGSSHRSVAGAKSGARVVGQAKPPALDADG